MACAITETGQQVWRTLLDHSLGHNTLRGHTAASFDVFDQNNHWPRRVSSCWLTYRYLALWIHILIENSRRYELYKTNLRTKGWARFDTGIFNSTEFIDQVEQKKVIVNFEFIGLVR